MYKKFPLHPVGVSFFLAALSLVIVSCLWCIFLVKEKLSAGQEAHDALWNNPGWAIIFGPNKG